MDNLKENSTIDKSIDLKETEVKIKKTKEKKVNKDSSSKKTSTKKVAAAKKVSATKKATANKTLTDKVIAPNKEAGVDIIKKDIKIKHSELIIQYNGVDISEYQILEDVKKYWKTNYTKNIINSLEVYYNVYERIAYCVINEEIKVDFKY